MTVLGTRVGSQQVGPSVPGVDVVYVKQSANLRRCPSTDCEAVAEPVPRNSQLVVIRYSEGEPVQGSNDWLEVEYGSSTAFVHSSVVAGTAGGPWAALELIFSIGLLGAAIALGLAGRSDRVAQLVADTGQTNQDIGLYGVAVVGGVVAGSIGYALAQADGQSLLSFWSSAFVNFGAGLVGAGVVFVIFQRITRARPDATTDLRSEVAQLRVAIEQLVIDPPAAHPCEDPPCARMSILGFLFQRWNARRRE